jgi:hypothetical protein
MILAFGYKWVLQYQLHVDATTCFWLQLAFVRAQLDHITLPPAAMADQGCISLPCYRLTPFQSAAVAFRATGPHNPHHLALLYFLLFFHPCYESSPLSVSLYHFFVSQILFVWLITSVSYIHLDLLIAFLIDFVCRLGYSFFCLGYFICYLDLLCSFNDNLVCCLSLLDQGHSFQCYHLSSSHHILLHYLLFAVMHHIISFLLHVISCSDVYHLFPLTQRLGLSFVVMHHIISFSLHVICCSDLYHLFGLTRRPGLHFEQINFACNFSFHVISLSILCNLL